MTEWNTRGWCASPCWAQDTDAAPPPLSGTASKMHRNGTQSLYCRVQQNQLQRWHKTPLLDYSPECDNEALIQVRASSPQEWPAVGNLGVRAGRWPETAGCLPTMPWEHQSRLLGLLVFLIIWINLYSSGIYSRPIPQSFQFICNILLYYYCCYYVYGSISCLVKSTQLEVEATTKLSQIRQTRKKENLVNSFTIRVRSKELHICSPQFRGANTIVWKEA